MGLKNIAAILFFSGGAVAHANQAMELVLKDMKSGYRAPVHFAPRHLDSISLADTHCTSVTQTLWLSSQHPGYGHRVNQHNWGNGFKCRMGTHNPTFVSVDGMTNSQSGATFALSFGKQFDITEVRLPFDFKARPYVGISVVGLSYEDPSKKKIFFGAVPMAHRGIEIVLPKQLLSNPLIPNQFKTVGTVGWEEQRLPVDGIRLRSVNAKIKVEF